MESLTTIPPTTAIQKPTAKEHIQRSIQANQDHQFALKTYTERLEAELESLDKLLAAAEVNEDDEPNLEVGGFVSVPGSARANAPVSSNDFLSEESPFFEDAERRQRYIDCTGYHPMKTKELEDLAEAVRTENYRLCALQAQRRGQFSFADLENKSPQFLEQNKDEIDWERVASTVSSKFPSHVQRTPKECEIRWLGDRHPEFNRSSWSQAEISQCRALVSNSSIGQVDWGKIGEQLGTHRTPIDCMRHGVIRRTHVWTPEADQKLLDAIQIYGINNWLIVARVVSADATAQQCQNRFQRTLDPDMKRGPWSQDEDAKLRLAVEAYGNSWLDVANTIEGRNNEQCRDRWNDKLDPKINREVWTEEEDGKLLDAVSEIGEGKWKAVSEVVGNGRKDNACRSRYEALKKRRGKGKAVDFGMDFDGAASSRQNSCRRNQRGQDDIQEPDDISCKDAPTNKSKPQPRKKYKKTAKREGVAIVAGEVANIPENGEDSEVGVFAEQRWFTWIITDEQQSEQEVPNEDEEVVNEHAIVDERTSSKQKSYSRKRRPANEDSSSTSQSRKRRKQNEKSGTKPKSIRCTKMGDRDAPEGSEQRFTNDTQAQLCQDGNLPRVPSQSVQVNEEADPDPGEPGFVPDAEAEKPVTRPIPRKRGRPPKVANGKAKMLSKQVEGDSVQPTVDGGGSSRGDPEDDLKGGEVGSMQVPDGMPEPREIETSAQIANVGSAPARRTRGSIAVARTVPTRKQPSRTVSQKRS